MVASPGVEPTQQDYPYHIFSLDLQTKFIVVISLAPWKIMKQFMFLVS
jgi:hypothetical protein